MDINANAASDRKSDLAKVPLNRGQRIIVILCYAGIIVANVYGFSMIATGLINAKLLPTNLVFGFVSEILYFAVAMFFQIGVLVVYLAMPLMIRAQFFINLVLILLWVVLVGLAIVFSIFSITLTSRGEELTRSNDEIIFDITTRVDGLDAQIAQTYTRQIENLEAMFQGSCGGQDRTGIARCGSIANSFRDRRQANIARFGAHLSPSTYSTAGDKQTHFAKVEVVAGNVETLRTKVGFYGEFARFNEIDPARLEDQFRSIERKLEVAREQIGTRSLTRTEIAFRQVFIDFGNALSGNTGWQFWLAFIIACLPDLLSVVFVLVLKIVAGATAKERVLLENIETSRRLESLYQRATGGIRRATKAFSEWSMARRGHNMAEAVDRSVPDS